MSEAPLSERLLAPGGVTPLYQPIFRALATPSLHGYECLTRGPVGTNLYQADVLFEYVRLKRMEGAIDRACVSAALGAAAAVPGAPPFSVNVHATTIASDRDFVEALARIARDNGIDPRRLTVEIVEHSPQLDTKSFLKNLERLREIPVSIALDDVGLGQSNFRMIIDVDPDYLKIDKYFVTGCDTEPRRRAIVESIADLARRFGAEAIAEGVERPEELATLRTLGIELVQGYLFARPMPIEAVIEAAKQDEGSRAG